jgi:hypothetical protein
MSSPQKSKKSKKRTLEFLRDEDPDLELPQNRRFELVADMRRVACDCRRGFGAAADPVREILTALLTVCPDATAGELNYVLTAAGHELDAEIVRCDAWGLGSRDLTTEKGVWIELAKGRIFDLNWARACLSMPRSEWTVKRPK